MLCAEPFRKGVEEYACGRCDRCLSFRRRVWTARIMLEASQHDACGFFTLTYKEMPAGYVWRGKRYASGSVRKDHVAEFMKRLRYFAEPLRLRYYGAAEYGSNGTMRPHYHIALFGTNSVELVGRAWTLGFVHGGQLTPASAAYVVSYVMKGWTYPDHVALNGRYPEFPFMSRRPGIGFGAVSALETAFVAGSRAWSTKEEMPSSIRAEGQMMPIGRYLRNKVAERLGVVSAAVPSGLGLDLAACASDVGTVRAIESREEVRVQHGRIARKRKEISLSKGRI